MAKRGGDRSAIARARGKRVGRPPKERPPEVGDKQFAARVLGKIGGVKWHEFREAVELYRNPPERPLDEKAAKAYEPPPHPKSLVKSDEDLVLYHTVCGDLGIESATTRSLIDKRDGKAMHTVNHLHDKPMELNVNLSVSERYRIAIEEGEKRVRERR